MRNIAPTTGLIACRPVKIAVWLASIIALIALTGCSDFKREFMITSANAKVRIGTDGTAVASETFGILVRDRNNYGGVYVDIPERFFNATGSHWRDLQLLAARRDGEDEYYSIENGLPGHSVYVGRRHCRHCHSDLPIGPMKIAIDYKLDRLVHDENDRQILVLPAYMASIHDQNGSKSLTFEVPKGGVKRPSAASASYDVTLDSEGKLVVYFPARQSRLPPPDIEIEYPKGTFAPAGSGYRAWWWVSDQLLSFASLLGPLFVFTFLVLRLTFRTAPVRVDADGRDLIEGVSPGLAGFVYHNQAPQARRSGLMASICALAIMGKLRLTELGEQADVFDMTKGISRSRRRMPSAPPSMKSAMACVRDRAWRKGHTALRDVLDRYGSAFQQSVAEEYRALRDSRLNVSLWLMAPTAAAGAFVAYLAGLTTFALAICGVLLVMAMLVTAVLHPERLPKFDWSWHQLKNTLGVVIGLPVIAAVAVVYIVRNPVTGDQVPYLTVIGADLTGIVLMLVFACFSTPKQRWLKGQVSRLRSYLLGETTGPEMSVAVYERHLPFALALGVEASWTSRFNRWRKETGMETYAPEWLAPQNSV